MFCHLKTLLIFKLDFTQCNLLSVSHVFLISKASVKSMKMEKPESHIRRDESVAETHESIRTLTCRVLLAQKINE